MIDFQQSGDVVKIMYKAQCKALGVPLTNKALTLDKLLSMWESDPDNTDVRELMFATLADQEFLSSPFSTITGEEADSVYDDIRKDIGKFYKKYVELAHMEDTFSDYESDEKELYWQSTAWNREWDKYLDEGCKVAEVIRETLQLGDEIENTLLRNVCCLIAQLRQDLYLEMSMPLILYLALIRYTDTFLQPTKTQVKIKDLFSYVTYDVTSSKKKVLKNHKRMAKLFRKLCKIYKKNQNTDLKQCKYGFYATSNLVQYVLEYETDKTDKLCPPFMDFLTYMDLSCMDSCCEDLEINKQWSMLGMFDVDEEAYDEYVELSEKVNYSDVAVGISVEEYVKKHEELIGDFMLNLYQDAPKIKSMVTDIYEQLKKSFANGFLGYEKAIKAEIYYTLMMLLDAKIEARVYKVCMM